MLRPVRWPDVGLTLTFFFFSACSPSGTSASAGLVLVIDACRSDKASKAGFNVFTGGLWVDETDGLDAETGVAEVVALVLTNLLVDLV